MQKPINPKSFSNAMSCTDTESMIDIADAAMFEIKQRMLLPFRKDGPNELHLLEDRVAQAAELRLNGEPLFMGNFWDFHPHCHGGALRILAYLYGNWKGPESLIRIIERYASDQLITLDVRRSKAKYDGKDWYQAGIVL